MYRAFSIMFLFGLTFNVIAQKSDQYLKSERYIFPDNGMSIKAPLHFDTTYLFNGLLHKATSSSITSFIARDRNPIAFNLSLTKEYFITQDLVLIKSEKIIMPTWEGVLYYLTFVINNIKMQRMMLVTGNYNDTHIVMANFPDMFSSQLVVPIRECMFTLLLKK
jgi:hypothetical protein